VKVAVSKYEIMFTLMLLSTLNSRH